MENIDYHFIAIGGIGQSALANILLKEGKKVSGSDISKSKYIDKLEALGAKIYIGHREENIQGSPVVVVSSAIKEDNPELKKAKELGLKVIHRSDLLKIISDNYPCFIGFCGTHGKTTTSGMCAYLLSKSGKKPCYAIGGIIPELNTNGECEDKNTKYFVAELDESDGTVVKYSPKITLINNLEADHLDFYKNGLADILKTFKEFILKLDNSSKIIINTDNDGNCELIKQNDQYKGFVSYTINDENALYKAKNIAYNGLSSSFEVFRDDKLLGKIELSIPGEHNIYNALGVCASLIEAGLDFNDFAKYFTTFSGMGRRFQKSAEFNNIKIIDDYAHHPSEIMATLKAVKSYKEGRIVAIFQPHRYSRFLGFYNEFKQALKSVDITFILDVYAASEKPIEGKTPKDFANEQTQAGLKCEYISGTIKEAAEKIYDKLEQNDLVLTFGAGDITKMGGELNGLYLHKK